MSLAARLTLIASLGCSLPAQSYEQLFQEAAAATARADWSTAAARYEAALKMRPSSVEARSNLGVVHYSSGRYAEAEATLRPLERTQRRLMPVQLILGLSRVRLGRYAEAVAPLEQALRVDEQNRDATLGLASALVGLERLDEAARIYQRHLAANQKDPEAWYALGVCSERLAEAETRKLSRLREGQAWAKRFLGEYWLERGNLALAQEALTEAARLEPEQNGLDALLDEAMRRSNARTPFEPWTAPAATATEGESAEAIYGRARAWSEKAREAFQRFVELAPDSWQAHLFLGDLARQRRDFPEAIRQYEAAARNMEKPGAALLGLGTVYWELADDEKAIRYLEEARKTNPRSEQAAFALGNIAVRQRRDAEAAGLLEECLRLAPDHLGAHADLGKAYAHLERWAEAVPHLRRARAIDTYGEIHFQLYRALSKLEQEEGAKEALEESKRIRAAQQERERRLKLLE